MFNIFEDPIFLTIVIGPIAGFFWSKFLNGKQDNSVPPGMHDQSVDLSGSNITNSGNLQAGSNNRISHVTNNYQSPKPTAGNGDGELVLAGIVGVIVTLTYLSYPQTSLLVSFAAVLFCLVFTLCYREAFAVKLYKSGLYGVLLYSLYSIWRFPIAQEYLDIIASLQGGGLKTYVRFVFSGFPGIPNNILFLALQQAGALFMIVCISHAVRVTNFSGSFQKLAVQAPVMAMVAFSPLYILNQQEASQFLFQMVW